MLKISIAILLTAISATRTDTANVVSTYETDTETVSVIETADGNIWEVGEVTMFDWFSVSDRLFVFFTCIIPLTTLFLFGVLFAEYKTEMRKRKKKRR